MEEDLDKKLYNDYLNGEKEAFEFLYNKYKNRIKYFIYNIVKDYQKAEDITQETFLSIMQNRFDMKYSFKYHIYLIAKSKSINYIKVKNRRNEINEIYLLNKNEVEKVVLEILEKEENRKELIDAINLLDEKYKNAIYLVNIEELSYKETSQILGESLQNTKNLIHRGKKQLRIILLKKGFDDMKNKKAVKFLSLFILIIIITSGVVYGTVKIIEQIKGKTQMIPTFTSQLSTIDTNNVWVGTFNLVWNDFMDEIIGKQIEFEDGYSALAEDLNKQSFTTKYLDTNSYFKIHGKENLELKRKIEEGIKKQFNETSKIIDNCNWDDPNGYVLYAMLKKEFNYLEKFQTLPDSTFGNSEEKVKYFGIKPDTSQKASKNIEILFYNSKDDFAIKLKTKEGEEVYLYRTTGEGKSFEENYKEMLNKKEKYTGNSEWNKNDILKIPFIKVNNEINYDELCGRYIKGTNWYIRQALQTIDFELNNYGGSVKSEALIEATKEAIIGNNKEFIFDDTFLLFLKEENKEKPYFALKVDNSDVLVSSNKI